MRARLRVGPWAVAAPPLLVLLALFAVPTLIMVAAAFRTAGDDGGLQPLIGTDAGGSWQLLIGADNWRRFITAENLLRLFGEPVYLAVLLRSLAYAALTTAICLTLGYPLAWFIARSPRPRRDWLVLLVMLPFWSNFLIRVYAWMILLGPQAFLSRALNAGLALLGLGPVTLLFTPFAVVVVLVYVHLPFMVLPLYANLEKHEPEWLDAARDLGAGAWQRFWRVTWPLSLPGVWAGAALVSIPAAGMFAVPDLVGGTSTLMIGNVIKQQFLDSRDWPFGAALSLMMTCVVLLLAGLAAWVARRAVVPRA